MKYPVILGSIMRDRVLRLAVLILPCLFILLNILHLFCWKCPFFTVTGIQCPGCGMTRGVIALLHGCITEALINHPFAPVLAAGWVGFAVISCLPEKRRTPLIEKIEKVEQKSGFVFIVTLLFICFGIARMLMQIYYG